MPAARIEIKGLDSLQRKLTAIERQGLPTAGVRALNRTATTVRASASRDIAREMGLPVSPVKKKIVIRRARKNRLYAVVRASGRPISLIQFAARQVRKGVSAKAWGKRKLYKGAFIARAKTHKADEIELRGTSEQVFVRKRSARLPIKKLWGPSIPRTMADETILKEIARTIDTTLPKRLEHELRAYVQRLRAKG